MCGLKLSRSVLEMRDFADWGHTRPCTALVASTPAPPKCWATTTGTYVSSLVVVPRKQERTRKNIYAQQAKDIALFYVGTAVALLIKRATLSLRTPGLHLRLLFPH